MGNEKVEWINRTMRKVNKQDMLTSLPNPQKKNWKSQMDFAIVPSTRQHDMRPSSWYLDEIPGFSLIVCCLWSRRTLHVGPMTNLKPPQSLSRIPVPNPPEITNMKLFWKVCSKAEKWLRNVRGIVASLSSKMPDKLFALMAQGDGGMRKHRNKWVTLAPDIFILGWHGSFKTTQQKHSITHVWLLMFPVLRSWTTKISFFWRNRCSLDFKVLSYNNWKMSLNSVYQRKFSDKLQSIPRIAQLFKSYKSTPLL